MKWIAKPTGDMTLSVLDENNKQILKVDMLTQNTMAAGLEGDKLAQAMNDLSVIAAFANGEDLRALELPYEDVSVSETPWSVLYNDAKRKLQVKSAKSKIADRVFPASFSQEHIRTIVDTLSKGVELFNGIKGNERA